MSESIELDNLPGNMRPGVMTPSPTSPAVMREQEAPKKKHSFKYWLNRLQREGAHGYEPSIPDVPPNGTGPIYNLTPELILEVLDLIKYHEAKSLRLVNRYFSRIISKDDLKNLRAELADELAEEDVNYESPIYHTMGPCYTCLQVKGRLHFDSTMIWPSISPGGNAPPANKHRRCVECSLRLKTLQPGATFFRDGKFLVFCKLCRRIASTPNEAPSAYCQTCGFLPRYWARHKSNMALRIGLVATSKRTAASFFFFYATFIAFCLTLSKGFLILSHLNRTEWKKADDYKAIVSMWGYLYIMVSAVMP